jgi:hypothetical protein
MKQIGIILAAMLLTCAMAGSSFAQSTVLMNEVYAAGVPGNLDWIEIYNAGGTPVNISGYKIYDIGGTTGKDKKPFPSGTVIPAYGFFVIVTDTATTGLNDKFGLSGTSGETVWLENGAGTIIDSVAFPPLGADTSYARRTNGSATWVKLSPTTKGVTNSQVVMNEVYAAGVPGNLDWIEIYNVSDDTIDISGYKIYDIGGTTGKDKKPFPGGTVIPTHGFYVIITDTASAGLNDKFGLSGTSGETVWLENSTGTIIDTVAFPPIGSDSSYARKPDGSLTWVKLTPATRGATNGGTTGVDGEKTLVSTFALLQNYPNPFNPSTTIGYTIVGAGHEAIGNRWVKLAVYDLLGREVALLVNENQQPGRYTVQFSADKLSSGIYFYALSAGSFFETKRMMVLK